MKHNPLPTMLFGVVGLILLILLIPASMLWWGASLTQSSGLLTARNVVMGIWGVSFLVWIVSTVIHLVNLERNNNPPKKK